MGSKALFLRVRVGLVLVAAALAAGGCGSGGGSLGTAPEGTTSSGDPLAFHTGQALFTVAGRAFIEPEVTSRQAESGVHIRNATARVVRLRGNGQVVEAAQGRLDADGSYSIPVPAAAGNAGRGEVWAVEVLGLAVSEIITDIRLWAAFVPGSEGLTLRRDVSAASTLVAAGLLNAATIPPMTQGDVDRLEEHAAAHARNGVDLLSLRPGAEERLTGQTVAAFNSAVDRIELLAGGEAASAANSASLTMRVGEEATLSARAIGDGAPLAIPLEFAVTGTGDPVTLTQTGPATAALSAVRTGSATVVVRIAVPGNTEAPRKSATLAVTVVNSAGAL
ncbi:MAG: hypothetical protein HY321_19475 [Armatimonadetes bacterium]|nr:hypothetical protein [Armatimonadota bacterium]